VGKLSGILHDTALSTYCYRCAKNGQQAKCILASGTVPAAEVYEWIMKISSCYQRTAMVSSEHFKTPERCICQQFFYHVRNDGGNTFVQLFIGVKMFQQTFETKMKKSCFSK
jgi:hypothetical protein